MDKYIFCLFKKYPIFDAIFENSPYIENSRLITLITVTELDIWQSVDIYSSVECLSWRHFPTTMFVEDNAAVGARVSACQRPAVVSLNTKDVLRIERPWSYYCVSLLYQTLCML